MVKRVRNEVSLHRRLNHPNVLALYHFFEDEERVYLVMELCARGEVYSLLRRRREAGEKAVLAEGEARAIFRDVVAGLKFLHSRGIIHRDLKLSNVLLAESGQAKIADFGLAVDSSSNEAAFQDDDDSSERTICGTPNYLAPEIVGKRRYGRSADIWSLGCLLYSFLCGRPPFDSPDLPSTFERVKNLDYRLPEHISPPAKDLIQRLLSPNPSDRPTFDQIIFHPFFNPSVTLPLFAARLAPLRQNTKYGSIAITPACQVIVDFLDAPDVLQISPDGLFINVFDRQNNAQSNSFMLAKLPEAYKKRYEYARRFVNLLRSKTPLIVLSTGRFRAYLMENAVNSGSSCGGDFHLHYRSAPLKLDYCWLSRQLRFTDSTSGITQLIISDPSLQIAQEIGDPLHRQALLEFLARYRQCLQVKDAILHADGHERAALKSSFPLVIREDSSAEEGGPNESVLKSPAAYNQSFMKNFNQSFVRNQSMNVSTSSLHQPPRRDEITTLRTVQKRFLKGVGWCLNDPRDPEKYLVLFEDGVELFVDGAGDLVFEGDRFWKIDSSLPEPLKQRLLQFSQFI